MKQSRTPRAGKSRSRTRTRVGVIGAGRVGSAIAWHCQRLGYRISGVSDRRPRQAWVVYGLLKLAYRRLRPRDVAAESDVLFLTVPDAHVGPEFEAVSRWLLPGTIVVHCSGTFGVEVFRGAHEQGLETLALHPIQTFSSHAQAITSLKGCYFALEGTRRGLRFGRRLVRQLRGGHIVVRGSRRPLYHAMCVFASNFLNALLDASEVIARRLELPRARAARMLRPLTRTVLENAAEFGAVATLTGPVQRGDAETVRRQLSALRMDVPELVPMYRVLTLRLADMARRQGVDRMALRRLRAVVGGGEQ
uniref:DUF2520 domain-containing protein n=1 Tax=candidate division WOR-3 bacterium TaxID=2052148 RepID=A0A7C4CB82_UNCW3